MHGNRSRLRRQAAFWPRAGAAALGALLAAGLHADMSAFSVGNAAATVTSAAPAQLAFKVKRSGDLGYGAVVQYTTADGSAVAGTDYTAQSGELQFPAGVGTQTVNVSVASEPGVLPDKQLYLQLTGAASGGAAPSLGARFDSVVANAQGKLVIADFNGDGKPDEIVNDAGAEVQVLLNTAAPGAATPAFAAPQPVPLGSQNVVGMAVGDFNGDGRPDLAVIGPVNAVAVALNATTPGSTSLALGTAKNYKVTGAVAVAVADVNGDGRPDLVVASKNGISVLLNNTKPGATVPSFAAPQSFAAGTLLNSVAVADLNGDGRPDLIGGDFSSGNVYVLLNTGAAGAAAASFAPAQAFAAGYPVTGLAAADLNGDGRPDVAVAGYSPGAIGGAYGVSVLLNATVPGAATASLRAAVNLDASHPTPLRLAVADVNGDGKPDLVVGSVDFDVPGYPGAVRLYVNETTPGAITPEFSLALEQAADGEPGSVAVGDLNGDGRVDIAVGDATGTNIASFLNTTPAPAAGFALGSQQLFAAGDGPHSVAVADFNGDGLPDLAVANHNDGTVTLALNTAVPGAKTASFAAASIASGASQPIGVAVADVNLDGLPDLVVAGQIGPAAVLLNTTAPGAATPSFAAPQLFNVGDLSPNSVLLADLNGDGKPDLVVPNFSSSVPHVSAYINTTVPGASTVSFGAQRTFGVGRSPTFVAAADFNLDGKPDLLVSGIGSATLLLNTTAPGAVTASFAFAQGFSSSSYAAAAADFNGDGLPDVALFDASGLEVFLNTTAPGGAAISFAAPQHFAVGAGPRFLAAADLDGDGRPDLLAVNRDDHTVSVLLNQTAPGASAASFAAQPALVTTTLPIALATGDFNGDGRPDLAVADEAADKFSVFLSKQALTVFSATPGTGTIHYAFAPPTISLTPASWAFPAEPVGTASGTKAFTVANTGAGSASFGAIAASGDFSVSSNACPSVLAPGKSCLVKVVFTPSASGARTGTLTVDSNAADSPAQAALSGSGR